MERSATLIRQSAVVPLRHVAPPAVKGSGLHRLSGRGRKSPSLRGANSGAATPRTPLLAPWRCSRARDRSENPVSPARAVLPRTGELVRPSFAHRRPKIGAGEGAGSSPGRGSSHPSRFPGADLADTRRPCGARTAAPLWASATAAGVGVRHSPKWGSIPASPRPRDRSAPAGVPGRRTPRLPNTADTFPRYRSVSYSTRLSCLHRAGAGVNTPSRLPPPPPPPEPKPGSPARCAIWLERRPGRDPHGDLELAPPAAPIWLSRWSVENTARPKRRCAAGYLARRNRPDPSPRGGPEDRLTVHCAPRHPAGRSASSRKDHAELRRLERSAALIP